MRKRVRTILALLTTAALIFFGREALRERSEPPETVRMVRIWIAEKEPAVSAWLRSLAGGYEKETGERVYLRLAAEEEVSAARRGEDGILLPDVLISPDAGEPVALRGYALILRDDMAGRTTPAPTSALFYRPSPSPGPSPVPGPTPDPASFSAVLALPELMDVISGTIRSGDPAADLARGKANAALLTAGQAGKLPFGYQAYPLPDGAGMRSVGAETYSAAGERFRVYLQRPEVQRTLAQFGLYSPFSRLYGPDDPLRFLIENSADLQEKTR